jgi:hypothetical protein
VGARSAKKFGVASREARKFGWGSREARRQEMVCAGAREARLHEDVLEMKVLLAQNPQKFSEGALRAGASRLPSSQH